MINTDDWNPLPRQTLHPLPDDAAFLASPRDTPLPKPRCLHLKPLYRLEVVLDAIIAIVAQQHRAQPSALLGNTLVPSSLELDFDVAELGSKPLRHSPPFDPKRAFSGLPTQVREAQEVKGFGFTQPSWRLSRAKRPNSIRLVLVGCSSKPKSAKRRDKALRNCSAS